jgi:hypothetical protein
MGKQTNPFSIDDEIDDAAPPKEPKEPVVDLDDEEEEDAEEEAPKPSRLAKKGERTWMNKSERERLEREAIEARATANATTLALQQVTQLAQQYARGSQQQAPQSSPIDQELERATTERAALDREYQLRVMDRSNPLTQDEANKLREKAIQLDDKRSELISVRAMQRAGVGASNPQADAIRSYLVANHPEAFQNQAAMNFAEGVQRSESAATGKHPYDMSVVQKAMAAAERQFGLGRYRQGAAREPDPNLRERYTGAPRGASGGAPKKGERQVVMTKDYQRMADAAYPHIKDQKKRWAHWAKEVNGDDD